MSGAFERHARPDSLLAIVCVTTHRRLADDLTRNFADRLGTIGVAAPLRLWADDTHFCDFTTGEAGLQTETARSTIGASTVLAGRGRPANSRAALAESLIGDRGPIAALLPEAREAHDRSTPREETAWAIGQLRKFHRDGIRLNAPDAARLLISVEKVPVRNRLWNDITRRTAHSHIALWRDLASRASDEVRTTPAALLGAASWINGDGALAWCALGQIPKGKPDALADLVASALHGAVHPRGWEGAKHLPIGRGSGLASSLGALARSPEAGSSRTAGGIY